MPTAPVTCELVDSSGPISLSTAGIWVRRPQWPRISAHIEDPLDVQLAEQESVAALGGLLRVIAGHCVSPADALQAARWKLPQLHLASRLGFLVPPTIVTSDPLRAHDFATGRTCVVKAVADARVGEGPEERVGLTELVGADIDWSDVRHAPVVIQEAVNKRADLRITAVGRRLFAINIMTPEGAAIDFRSADADECDYEVVDLPRGLADGCREFLDFYGLRYGAFDFAVDHHGEPWFLECNPSGQWGWLEAMTGAPITASLVDLLLEVRK